MTPGCFRRLRHWHRRARCADRSASPLRLQSIPATTGMGIPATTDMAALRHDWPMLAVFAADSNSDDPLSALQIGDRPDPKAPDGWTTVAVQAASLNHHDLWSLRGVGLPAER